MSISFDFGTLIIHSRYLGSIVHTMSMHELYTTLFLYVDMYIYIYIYIHEYTRLITLPPVELIDQFCPVFQAL